MVTVKAGRSKIIAALRMPIPEMVAFYLIYKYFVTAQICCAVTK